MADQHNDNIPALGNQISADVPDIKENLEFHKDVFEAITSGWSNTSTSDLKLVAPDHGSADLDQVVNVCYGTGSAPTANTTTIGSLFIKYSA